MSIEERMNKLYEISLFNTVPFGRVDSIYEREEIYAEHVQKYRGYHYASDAFKSFYLETIGSANVEVNAQNVAPLPYAYAIFMPKMIEGFKSICGAERIASRGYPFLGYTSLRNTFDALVLVSSALQGMTTFHALEGLVEGQPDDPMTTKKIRKSTEFEIRQKMTGKASGLTERTLAALKLWDELFDHETHGAHLSRAGSATWIKGEKPLSVLPEFDESSFAMFMNRCLEIEWMFHRLIPFVRPQGVALHPEWSEKWQAIDACLRVQVESLTTDLGKDIGAAIVELVTVKFPFSHESYFPR